MLQAADMGGSDAGTRAGEGEDHSYTVILNPEGHLLLKMTAETIKSCQSSSSSFSWFRSSVG